MSKGFALYGRRVGVQEYGISNAALLEKAQQAQGPGDPRAVLATSG